MKMKELYKEIYKLNDNYEKINELLHRVAENEQINYKDLCISVITYYNYMIRKELKEYEEKYNIRIK